MTHTELDFKHNHTVLRAGYIAIATNLLLALFKILVGALSNSLAVMSDALHGLVDTLSGIIVVVSEKLGASHKFSKNHKTIERTGAILIAVIIIVVGIHIFVEAIEQLITPSDDITYSLPTVIVLISSLVVKLLLGKYLKRTGEAVHSDTLVASSVETINDSIISGAVLASALLHLLWHINAEPYITIAISIIIVKFGLQLIFPSRFHHHH